MYKRQATSDGTTPLNLTGATVALYVKGSASAILVPAQSTTTITNAALGQSTIEVSPAQQTAAGITAGQVGNYVLRIALLDGTVTDQNIGSFTIRQTAAT